LEDGRLAQGLTGLGTVRLAQLPPECDGLLDMELVERAEFGRNLEAMKRLGHRVEAGLTQALGCLEIDQVFAFDALVFGIVLAHVSGLMP
jgi:hypothetical protein